MGEEDTVRGQVLLRPQTRLQRWKRLLVMLQGVQVGFTMLIGHAQCGECHQGMVKLQKNLISPIS